MIDRLQQHLSDIYQVGGVHDVRDFLITDPRLARYIGAVRVATQYLEEALVDEDQIQALDEKCEAILAERKVFV